MTQEQANAIAEREYPYPIGSMPWYNYIQTRFEVGFRREAYAKALMDMNPLIKAAIEMRESITCENQTDGATLRCCDACWGMTAWDTALSNLTKNT